jgi:hypothetical protein
MTSPRAEPASGCCTAHDLGLDRVDVSREAVDEVVLRQPGEALLVDVEARERGAREALTQQRAD